MYQTSTRNGGTRYQVPSARSSLNLFLSLIVLTALGLSLGVWPQKIAAGHRNFYQLIFLDLAEHWDLECFGSRFQDFGTERFFEPHGRYVVQPEDRINPGTRVYVTQDFNYPPLVATLYLGFYRQPFRAMTVYRVVFCAWLAVCASVFGLECRKRRIAPWFPSLTALLLLLLSWPVLIMLRLANLELFVWILLGSGLWAFFKDRWWTAAICFGLAGSLKYYPLLFLGLFSFRKQFPKILAGCAAFMLSSALALASMGTSIQRTLRGLQGQMQGFRQYYLLEWHAEESSMDHSLFALIKLFYRQHTSRLPSVLAVYTVLTVTILLALYIIRLRHLPLLNRLLAFSIASVWLPPLSHDYTLVNLFIPLGILLLRTSESLDRKTASALAAICIAFGICCAVLSWFQVHGFRYGGQIRCLCLAVIFVIAFVRNLQPEPCISLSLCRPEPISI